METVLTIHQRINFKSFFPPQKEDFYFFRANRLNTDYSHCLTKTDEPFMTEKSRMHKMFRRTSGIVQRAKF